MAKKHPKKKKQQRTDTDGYPTQKKGGMLMYVPAFCSLIGTLMLITVIAVALPLTVPQFMGYDIYNVVSGSMEPAIPIGSIIYVKEIDPVDVKKGDVIVFNSGDSVVMHRVKENDVINGTFTTKGDANDGEDLSKVDYENMVGIVARHIPTMGQLLILFGSTLGRICMICFAACGALLNVLGARFSEYLKYEREAEQRREEQLAKARQAEQDRQDSSPDTEGQPESENSVPQDESESVKEQ